MPGKQLKYNFYESSIRHYRDGLILFNKNRNPNAGQLFGFSTECGIKALMITCGYKTTPDGDIEQKQTPKIRYHLNDLIKVINGIEIFLEGRSGSKYSALLSNLHKFSDWHVDHRYYSEGAIPLSINNWKISADEVRYMLQCLMFDGRVI